MSNQTDDAPEGFKMTELGSIPDDWRVVKLGDIADSVIGGGTPSTARSDYWDGPIQWTTSRRISGTHLGSGERGITQKGLEESSTHLIPRGNLLVGTRVGVGKVAVNDVDMAISQDLTGVFVNRGKYSVDFLVFQMLSARIQEEFEHCARGTTIKGIPRDDLVKIPLAIPPLSEQEAIARVLSIIERTIETQDKVMAAASELKKSLMKHLFTYGPVPVAEAERIQLKETEIGSVPDHWDVIRLGNVFDVRQGKALSPVHRRGTNPQPFLRTANVYWGYLELANLDRMDFTDSETSQLKLIPDDLLVCEGGDIGRTAIWQGELDVCCYQNHLHRLRTARGDVCPLFYMYWMQAAYLLFDLYGGQGNKTTIPNLSQSRLKSFMLPFPPVHEQKGITAFLSIVDRRIEAGEKRKASLQTLFKTMLHHLMTGKLRVKDLEATA